MSYHAACRGGVVLLSLTAIFNPQQTPPVTTPLFRPLITDDMHTVDRIIRSDLYSDVVLIRQVAEYIIGAGGKRLRPALVLLAARALGMSGEAVCKQAAMVEFIHTATLLHDDVVDESPLRRGRDTANALFGNAASVLVGDFLYTRAFQMMVGTQNLRILEVMAEATNIISEGEVLQLLNIGNTDIDEAAYLRVIQYKTAKLFEAAGRVGAMLAQASPAQEQALADYGMHLGTAFQIIDDVLDYSGDADTIGKSLGDDLAEGKPTLPLIYVMQQGAPADAALVTEALQHANRDHFAAVLAAVQRAGALDYARARAAEAAEAAVRALDALPDTETRTAMVELARLSVSRDA